MTGRLRDTGLKVFATCPPSYTASPQIYLREVLDVARWSEAAGCEGILIYTDNGLVDPWLIAQAMITHTERLCPLVAVQPVYMHPYAVAKMVASLGFLHKRRVYLNMVAGGFKNDLESLNDPTPHDERYTRLVEYTKLILDLVSGPRPVTLNGRYYQVANVKMTPPLELDLLLLLEHFPLGIAHVAADPLDILLVSRPFNLQGGALRLSPRAELNELATFLF